jgi:hypothetical protein
MLWAVVVVEPRRRSGWRLEEQFNPFQSASFYSHDDVAVEPISAHAVKGLQFLRMISGEVNFLVVVSNSRDMIQICLGSVDKYTHVTFCADR